MFAKYIVGEIFDNTLQRLIAIFKILSKLHNTLEIAMATYSACVLLKLITSWNLHSNALKNTKYPDRYTVEFDLNVT